MKSNLIAIALIISACSTTVEPQSADEIASRIRQFEAGMISLDCGTGCAFSYGGSRTELKRLHDQELWSELALRVISIRYDEDLAWYYLARSAEGLGHEDAADAYYRIARASTLKCSAYWNTCDGIDIRAATAKRMRGLSLNSTNSEPETTRLIDPVGSGVDADPRLASTLPAQTAPASSIETPAKARVKEKQSSPGRHDDWYSQPHMVLGITTVQIPLQEEAARLALSFDGRRVRLSGLYSREYYMRFFSKTLPDFAVLGGKPYVAYPWFFEEETPATIRVGDVEVKMLWDGAAHRIASESDSRRLVQAFATGTAANVVYSASNSTELRHFESKIPLAGFGSALKALPDSTISIPGPENSQDPLDLIAPHLTDNQFEVSRDNLRRMDNPNGEGQFVYVPETRFNGTERLFIWYVNRGHAAKINGATGSLTPGLPFPREAQYEIWRDSGLTHDSVTQVGLDTVFSR